MYLVASVVVVVVILAAALIYFYGQNPDGQANGGQTTPSPEPTPTPSFTGSPEPTPTPDGAALYSTYCSGCHGALANSQRKGRTAEQIKGALQSVPPMRSIDLTDAQIQAIADALADP